MSQSHMSLRNEYLMKAWLAVRHGDKAWALVCLGDAMAECNRVGNKVLAGRIFAAMSYARRMP